MEMKVFPVVSFSANVTAAAEQGRPLSKAAGVVVNVLSVGSSLKMLLPLISVCFIAVVTSHALNTPEVHEIVDESMEAKSNRHPRQPNSSPKTLIYTPPRFEYKSAVQQNPRLLRYYRQQQVDLAQRRKEQIAPVTPNPIAKALLENTRRNIHILPVTVAQPEQLLRVARKLTSKHYNDEDLTPTAAPTQAIYAQPEHDLKALNDLIGKNPNVQLQGLKQLLENPSQVQLIMPSPADPSPFQAAADEDTTELIYKQDDPNIISKLQAELDASARVQVQNAIAAAQRQALAHVEEQHKVIAVAQEEARRIAMEKVRAHNEAISQVYIRQKEEVHPEQTAENRHQVVAVVEEPHRVVYEESQEELQRLAEESNRAYGAGDDVSKSKCKKFVNEKLEMFRQQFCNHLKYSPAKGVVRNETLKNFVLELNCVKMERAKNFFSTKLREMYRENRKAFFSLCYFNVSHIQLINEFVFSNNLTDFNENLLRQKREISDEGETDYDYYYDETDVLPSAQKLVASPKFDKHPPDDNKINKEPTNVIVINNSNDHHNHGPNVEFQHKLPPVKHRPVKHRHKKPKRTHIHKITIHHKKPSVKRILRVSKKIDTVLNKLGHTIIRIR